MIDFFLTTYNRKEITKRCIQNLNKIKIKRYGSFHIHDDCSDEYDFKWLNKFKPNKVSVSEHIGIDRIMLQRIAQFKRQDEFEYFYSLDNDMIHDPSFVTKALELYEKYKLPLTLYNTKYHNKNIIRENSEVYVLKSFPGASIFFHKKDVVNIKDYRILGNGNRGWDWHMGILWKKTFICPKTSYCDHYGEEGMHNCSDDIAENPTEFLLEERTKIK